MSSYRVPVSVVSTVFDKKGGRAGGARISVLVGANKYRWELIFELERTSQLKHGLVIALDLIAIQGALREMQIYDRRIVSGHEVIRELTLFTIGWETSNRYGEIRVIDSNSRLILQHGPR